MKCLSDGSNRQAKNGGSRIRARTGLSRCDSLVVGVPWRLRDAGQHWTKAKMRSTLEPPYFLRSQESSGGSSRQTWACRLGMVRLFAQWLHSIDPRNETPPRGLIAYRQRRSRPYIYTDEEIRRIVQAAAELHSINGLRQVTMSALLGLLAVRDCESERQSRSTSPM